MTTKTTAKILLTVTMLMAFGFGMMLRKALYVPCGILACVWAAHLVYFLFGVKTIETKKERDAERLLKTKAIAKTDAGPYRAASVSLIFLCQNKSSILSR